MIDSKKYGRETEDLGRQPLLDEALGKLLSLTETDARAQNAGEEKERCLNAYLQKLLLGEKA